MLEETYEKAHKIAHKNKQTVGEKHDLYITLEQLSQILQDFEG